MIGPRGEKKRGSKAPTKGEPESMISSSLLRGRVVNRIAEGPVVAPLGSPEGCASHMSKGPCRRSDFMLRAPDGVIPREASQMGLRQPSATSRDLERKRAA